MSIEFQFCKMKKALETRYPTMRVYVTLPNYTLVNG